MRELNARTGVTEVKALPGTAAVLGAYRRRAALRGSRP